MYTVLRASLRLFKFNPVEFSPVTAGMTYILCWNLESIYSPMTSDHRRYCVEYTLDNYPGWQWIRTQYSLLSKYCSESDLTMIAAFTQVIRRLCRNIWRYSERPSNTPAGPEAR